MAASKACIPTKGPTPLSPSILTIAGATRSFVIFALGLIPLTNKRSP